MYIPAPREAVHVDSNEQIWRVVRVDYSNRAADLVTVINPRQEWRAVPFTALLAVCDEYAQDS